MRHADRQDDVAHEEARAGLDHVRGARVEDDGRVALSLDAVGGVVVGDEDTALVVDVDEEWGVTLLVDSRYQEGTTRRDVIETQEVHPGVQG